MTGGDGGVGGKNQTGRGEGVRFLKGEFLVPSGAPLAPAQERGVSLVHVVDRGLESSGFQSAIATDPQNDLLLEPHLEVAAIKLVGNFAVLRRIVGKVGIQQKQSEPADVHRHTCASTVPSGSSTATRMSGTSLIGRVWKSLSS